MIDMFEVLLKVTPIEAIFITILMLLFSMVILAIFYMWIKLINKLLDLKFEVVDKILHKLKVIK